MRNFLTGIAPLGRAQSITKPLFLVQGSERSAGAGERGGADDKDGARQQDPRPGTCLPQRRGHGFAKKRNQDSSTYHLVSCRKYLLKVAFPRLRSFSAKNQTAQVLCAGPIPP